MIPKTSADLLEQAVLAREMAAGRVEAIQVPINCLDVLAQQIVAMTAMDTWAPMSLYQLVRRAYPYRDLSAEAFEKVLEMISGRYRWRQGKRSPATLNALQPRISWDRLNNRLLALPGSQRLALVSGGTIPDTGQYAAYDLHGVRIGDSTKNSSTSAGLATPFTWGRTAGGSKRSSRSRAGFVGRGSALAGAFWRGERPAAPGTWASCLEASWRDGRPSR